MKKMFAFIGAAVVAATAAVATEHQHGAEDPHVHKVMNDKGRENLTLIQVMHDLAANMNRVQWGIMTNNRYMVEQGAGAIAEHPMPQGGLKPYVKKNAEMIKDVVPEYDRLIHKTAMEMKERAADASMQDLQAMANKMAEGCVSCHDVFRNP